MYADLEVDDKRSDKSRMGEDELFSPENMKEIKNLGMLNNPINENQILFIVKNDWIIPALAHLINICFNTTENILKSLLERQVLLQNEDNNSSSLIETFVVTRYSKLFLKPYRAAVNYLQQIHYLLKES